MGCLVLYLSSVVLGGVGAWLVVRWGSGFGLLDKANHRSSHEGVVPKGGGIGILAAFVFASIALGISASFWLSATFLALFSFCGDRIEISPKIRLPVQFIAALILLFPILFTDSSSAFCSLSSVFCLLPLSVFVVGTANYYNFMDGINGIGGITGVVGFGLVAWFAALSGSPSFFLILAVCMGLACIGFLPFNVQKNAHVFMGDVGSVLLGFVYAGMVVWLMHSLNDFVVLCAFLFPFYADELTTEYVRLRDGENLLRPHRRHLYQLLANEMEVDHWKVAVGYGVLQLVVGVSVLLLRNFGSVVVLAVLGGYFGGFIGVSWIVRRKVVTLDVSSN